MTSLRHRVGRTRRVGAALVLLAAVSTACGGGGSGFRADDSPAGQVRALLRERAAHLAEGDVAAYLEAVDPAAEAQERAVAEGAAAVPLSYANASFDPQGGGKTTATSFRDARVELVFRYEGLPLENLFRFALEYDLDRRGDSWVVTRSAVAQGDLLPPIWVTGPVEYTRSEHFLALHRPGVTGAAEVLEAAEQGRTRLEERLEGLKSDPMHLVLLAGDDQQYAEIKGAPAGDGEVAAARFLLNAISRPEERQMVVNAGRLADGSAEATAEDGVRAPAAEVFQHELAHLALTRFDGPFTPAWVNEGAAMYLADERRVQAWKAGLELGLYEGMSVGDMGRDEGLGDGVEYAYANAAVLFLIQEFSAETFFDYYRSFFPLAPTPEFEEDPTAVTLEERYGLSVSQLDERTRQFMAEAAGAG